MNILLTSAGRRTYMVEYFKTALNGTGFVHASNSILTYTLKQADKYVITPNIYDDNYIDFLLAYCKENNISVIISLFDIDLPVLAKNKELFKQNGITVIVSDYEVTQICNDKWATYNFITSLGLTQPKTYLNINQAKAALSSGEIHYPVIIKPRWGMASIGIYKIETDEELDVMYKKLHREIFNTYLKYESAIDESTCILIQESINGQEYGIEVLNDLEGNYVTTLAKKKIAMRAGETDIAEIIDSKDFSPIGKLISNNLHHIGNLDIDIFVTPEGKKIVLEMNCRFGGQYPFSHLAGANFPKQLIEWLEGKPTIKSNITTQPIFACKELHPVIIS